MCWALGTIMTSCTNKARAWSTSVPWAGARVRQKPSTTRAKSSAMFSRRALDQMYLVRAERRHDRPAHPRRGKGINDSGQIVGNLITSGYTANHAFLYQNGVTSDLGTLGGSFTD